MHHRHRWTNRHHLCLEHLALQHQADHLVESLVDTLSEHMVEHPAEYLSVQHLADLAGSRHRSLLLEPLER